MEVMDVGLRRHDEGVARWSLFSPIRTALSGSVRLTRVVWPEQARNPTWTGLRRPGVRGHSPHHVPCPPDPDRAPVRYEATQPWQDRLFHSKVPWKFRT